MKISLVTMRPLPGAHRPAMSRSGSSPVIPAWPRDAEARPCPECMDPALWLQLGVRIADVQAGGSIGNAEFRAIVRLVVLALRTTGEAWDVVYSTLDSAVRPAPDPAASLSLELEVYATRSASIVAHMHSWADVERLAEIEEEGLTS